jgi:hypothetical protein
MKTVARIAVVALAVVALGSAGCGKVRTSADRSKLMNDMKQLGLAYHNFQDAEGRPPKSFDELNKKFPLPAGASQVTVIWGGAIRGTDVEGPSSEIVLGHAPDPDGKGVLALMCDASVVRMTNAEFESAKKAKPPKR